MKLPPASFDRLLWNELGRRREGEHVLVRGDSQVPRLVGGIGFALTLAVWWWTIQQQFGPASALFMLWVVGLFTPAMLVFLKVYEERELEVRFGASYLEYRASTPMLWPRRPKG